MESDKEQTTGARCPLCGRSQGVWLGDPPTRCLIGNADTICQSAMNEAYGAAMRRKVCPEAHDANGVILPDGLLLVTTAMHAAGLNLFSGRAEADV